MELLENRLAFCAGNTRSICMQTYKSNYYFNFRTDDFDVSWQNWVGSQVDVSLDGEPDGGGVVEVLLRGVEEDSDADDEGLQRGVEADHDHAVEVLAELVAEPGAQLGDEWRVKLHTYMHAMRGLYLEPYVVTRKEC